MDEQSFIDNVDLNLFSAYRATQAVLPGMVERKWGRIINIGSGYARHSGGDFAYTAAKHGIVGLTRAMAAKVALDGVCINCLCPTWTHTQLINYDNWTEEQRRERIAANLQKRILQPEELGPMAVLLASEEGSSMTGQVVCVDGGDWICEDNQPIWKQRFIHRGEQDDPIGVCAAAQVRHERRGLPGALGAEVRPVDGQLRRRARCAQVRTVRHVGRGSRGRGLDREPRPRDGALVRRGQ